MHSRLRRGYQLWQHMGTDWVLYRLRHALDQRRGRLQKELPLRQWEEQPLATLVRDAELGDADRLVAFRSQQGPQFLFSHGDRAAYRPYFSRWDAEPPQVVFTADQIGAGAFRYFSYHTVAAGFPPAWNRNALTGEEAPPDRHWSTISDFAAGDIKVIWEPSRFGFVFPLVRAYWRTGDERYAEWFWQLLADWRRHNPPQHGPNWKCGQETSLRVMALSFALYGFAGASNTTPQRTADLVQTVAVSGQRIAAHLEYALSQRNNHGISEGMGLWTIGLLFPELSEAPRWRTRGQEILERLAHELIYDDGSFVQHSMNYHRLMLQDYLWSIRIGDLNGVPLSAALRSRVAQATEFLYQVQDPISGGVPRCGANDGAWILPLDNCDYADYRPVVQAGSYLTTGRRRYEPGPWDEDLLWLCGPDALAASQSAPPRVDFQAAIGGYDVLRAGDSFVLARCAPFRDRPSHADQLHVDLWWRGENVALDAGTYSYNAPPPWDDPLARTAYHNTITVGGLDQMGRATRFLWLPWAQGRVRYRAGSAQGHLVYWEGEHDGYRRLKLSVRHRRAILRLGDLWLVLDELVGQGPQRYRQHWLLADRPHRWQPELGQLALEFSEGEYNVYLPAGSTGVELELVRAQDDSPRGWCAPYYYTRRPALSLTAAQTASAARFWTLFSPIPAQVAVDGHDIRIMTASAVACVACGERWDEPLVSTAEMAGLLTDRLDLRECTHC